MQYHLWKYRFVHLIWIIDFTKGSKDSPTLDSYGTDPLKWSANTTEVYDRGGFMSNILL